MQRYIVAIVAMFCLLTAYVLYGAIVNPLTVAEEAPQPAPLIDHAEYRPPALLAVTEEFFPDAPWTGQAQLSWQRSTHSFLFASKVVPETNGNSVELSPLAILWNDPNHPEGKPFRLIAEKAYVQFQNPFFGTSASLMESDPGRIVWASLEGQVHIDGPDGLVIDGRQFIFSEKAAQLWSDFDLTFAYGPSPRDGTRVVGRANKINLSLVVAAEPVLGKDMPRIAGISQVMLRQNVHLDITSHKGETFQRAIVSSVGPFEFDVESGEASFEKEVVVDHQLRKGDQTRLQKLRCDWLGLDFGKGTDLDSSGENLGRRLLDGRRFRRMSAQSRSGPGNKASQVFVESEEHGLVATMQNLMYDAINRVAVLTDDRQVSIRRGETTFKSPKIRIVHGEGASLESLSCSGAGSLRFVEDKEGATPVDAAWDGSLTALPIPGSPHHLIQLNHNARVVVPHQFGIGSDVMKLTADLREAGSVSKQENSVARRSPLQRAVAEGNVRVASPQLIVNRADVIDLAVIPGEVIPIDEGKGIRSASGGDPAASVDSAPSSPWKVDAGQLKIDVIHNAATGKIALRKLTGDGPVRVEHQPAQPVDLGGTELQGPVVITGVGIIAENHGGLHQSVTLLGAVDDQGAVTSPALLSLGDLKFGGANVSLIRHENRVEIHGPGVVQVPITGGLDGGRIGRPSLLNIVWKERMTFDGVQARCFGGVKTSLQQEENTGTWLHCEELSATLNHRISFENPRQRPENAAIETLEARHNVNLSAYEYANSKLVAVRTAQLADFHLNQTTGRFTGTGPGTVKMWTYGDSVKFSPTQKAQANQPAKSDKPRWRFTSIQFMGQMSGNIQQSVLELEDRITVLTAPVDQAKAEFHAGQLSENTEQAAHAVSLKCKKLRAMQRSYEGSTKKFSELFATGSAELEGQKFRAVAEELSYDERRGQFVLRGLGRDATLYLQREFGGPVSSSTHRLIEFIPSEPRITVDGSTGLSGGF